MTSQPSVHTQTVATPAATHRAWHLPLALRQHAPLLTLLAVGLLLRLYFIAVSPLNPAFSTADDGDYYRRALHLATTGEYRDDFWLIRPPGAVFFFAGPLQLALAAGFPEYGWRLIQAVQVALGLLTAALGYDLVRRLFNPRAGLWFAAFLLLWYSFVELPSVLFTELLYTFLFTLHLWLLALFDQGKRQQTQGERQKVTGKNSASVPPLVYLVAAGLTLGVAALVRSPALYAAAFVALWLWVRAFVALPPRGLVTRSWLALRRALWPSVVFVAAVLLVVGPWTLRNYQVYNRFIPIDTLGPINLWLDFGSPDERNPKIQTLLTLPQADRQAYAQAQLRLELDGRPWLLFKDAWENFRHVWKAQFVEDFLVKNSFFTRPLRETWPLGVLGDPLWLVFALGGLAALAAPVREGWHWRLLILAWLGYSFLTIFLFHVEPRYLLPIWFLLGLYGAAALAKPRALLGDLRRAPLNGLLAAGLVGAALALILTYRPYATVIANGIARETAYAQGARAYAKGDYPAAEAAFRAALVAQPSSFDIRADLALAIAAQGRPDEAYQLVKNGGPRRTNLVAAHLARTLGQKDTARRLFDLVEYTAGEDAQRYAMEVLPVAPLRRLQLGDDLDMGYMAGFASGEQANGWSFRWLEGRGRVQLPLDAPLATGSTVAIRAAGGLAGVSPLTIGFADGTRVTVPVQEGEWRVYHVAVPEELVGSTRLLLALRAPTFIPALRNPGSDDTRTLSLMISDVSVD